MSLPSAIPVPTPALADPLALFQLRCAHRRRARSLKVAIAKGGGNFALRSLGEGGRSLSDAGPSDFDALFQDQSLTIRLSPPQRAALELCAQHIAADPAQAPCDFGAMSVTALRPHATGLARQEIDTFMRQYSPDALPHGCSTLPSIRVPAATAEGGATLRSVSEAGPSQFAGLSRDLRLVRRQQRQTSRLCLARQREAPCEAQRAKQGRDPRSFQLLLCKQTELAHAGRSSGFSAWLKAHNIPRQSAYRLLNKISKPAPCKDLICTKREPAPPADLELLPDAARFRLSSFHSALAHRILLDARDRRPRRDLATPVVHAFLQFLSGPHRATALAWLDHSDPDCPLPRGPHPRFCNRSCRR